MSRLSSQGSTIVIQDTTGTVQTIKVASATKAKPCVITLATGTAPIVGTVVIPRLTGWPSIDNMPFKVSLVAAQVITLEDSDTTSEVATINSTVGTIDKPTFLELCRANFTANQPAGATIDVTTLCDDAHKIVAGLPAIGTWTAPGFYDCADLALQVARDAYRSGAKVALDIRLPDGCGFTFMAIVNTYDVALGVNVAITNTVGGQIDGTVHFYKTPPAPGTAFEEFTAPPPPELAQVAA